MFKLVEAFVTEHDRDKIKTPFKLFEATLVHAQHLHTGVFVQLVLILDLFAILLVLFDHLFYFVLLAGLVSYLLDFSGVISEVQLVNIFQAKAKIIVFDVYVCELADRFPMAFSYVWVMKPRH